MRVRSSANSVTTFRACSRPLGARRQRELRNPLPRCVRPRRRRQRELPSSAVFADTAAPVVADDIAARLDRSDRPLPFEGDGTCYIEFGGGTVGRIEANFLGGPEPTALIVGPSLRAAKAGCRRRRWTHTTRESITVY